jgi:hypothetical protein
MMAFGSLLFHLVVIKKVWKCLEVVSKPPLRPNFCVGPRDSILKILNIFLRLNPSLRHDFEPD